MATNRVDVTSKAKEVIDKLRDAHGELIFCQSGGCCDGTTVMCFSKDEFILGSSDLKIGNIHGCDFYMSEDQFEYTRHSHITIDVERGRGSGFSLETSLGFRFITTSRLFTDKEIENLEEIN